MFQSLASYFYGSTNENDAPTAGQDLVATAQLDKNAPPVEQTPRLVTKPCDEHDDEDETEVSDWLLVDKEGNIQTSPLHSNWSTIVTCFMLASTDSPAQTDSEDEIHFVQIKNAPVVPYRRGRGHSRNHSGAGSHDGLLSLSPASLLPSSMDESWFVTPPPCFTSVGPVSMEMSPFENLLIEHPRLVGKRVHCFASVYLSSILALCPNLPSMSVYHSMRRSQTSATGAAGAEGGDDADDDDLIVVDMTAAGQGVVVAPVVHPAAERSPAHVSVCSEI